MTTRCLRERGPREAEWLAMSSAVVAPRGASPSRDGYPLITDLETRVALAASLLTQSKTRGAKSCYLITMCRQFVVFVSFHKHHLLYEYCCVWIVSTKVSVICMQNKLDDSLYFALLMNANHSPRSQCVLSPFASLRSTLPSVA